MILDTESNKNVENLLCCILHKSTNKHSHRRDVALVAIVVLLIY